MPSAGALFSTDVSAFGLSRKKVVGQGFHDESNCGLVVSGPPLRAATSAMTMAKNVRWFICPSMRQVNNAGRSVP